MLWAGVNTGSCLVGELAPILGDFETFRFPPELGG